MHLKQYLKPKAMSYMHEFGTALDSKAGGNEEYGRGSAEGCLVKLELVDDKVLI
jgi:hypothetical protein